MNTALWILTALLAVAFVVGGSAQIALDRDRYRNLATSQHWVDDFSAGQLKAIGTIKVLGAVGLLLPAVGDTAPVLVPLAACGLVLFMAGAGTTRFRRREWPLLAGDLAYLALFAFIAWGRFGLEPFV